MKGMHNHTTGICNPGGINTLEKSFSLTYYCRGIRSIVKSVLEKCTGTCKLSKTLKTMPPAPRAIRTMQVMEQVQCVQSPQKKVFLSAMITLLLCVKDCFSKYCWLTPLQSKEALIWARVLSKIFHDHGPPTFLHSDNGSEFVNTFVKDLCSTFDVRIKHGRPYHPQSQGQVENLNRRVKNCLRHFLLAYEECDRATAWPGLVKEIEYFLNHTWHYTTQCTPYTAFHGRTGSVKMGDKYSEHAEDFFTIHDDEEELYFDPSSVSSCDMSLSKHYGKQQALQMLGEVQLQQAEITKKVFEAMESMILHNKRAHIKRMKLRNYSRGHNVLFRNPSSDGLASTLNVRGEIVEKIGIDLYQVKYSGDKSIVLFGSQMVIEDALSGIDPHQQSLAEGDESKQPMGTLTLDYVLEKISNLADSQKKYIVAKRKYKAIAGVSIDDVTKHI